MTDSLDEGVRSFWSRTLADARRQASPPEFVEVASRHRTVRVFDVRFSGFGGERIAGWLILPRAVGRFPAVVEYVGHGGGRGYAHEHLFWASAGYAHFVMDARGQGSGWRIGATPDSGPLAPGSDAFFTRGITDPNTYFYRRMYTDAVLAVDAVRSHSQIDLTKVAAIGTSQGGGLAIATAALRDDLAAVVADVPGFGAFRLAVDAAEEGPYLRIADYLAVHREEVERVFDVLHHFDTTTLGRFATAPALFSLGGRDLLVPPETIRLAVAAYAGPTVLLEYPFNGHEGGGALHQLRALEWLDETMRTEPEPC